MTGKAKLQDIKTIYCECLSPRPHFSTMFICKFQFQRSVLVNMLTVAFRFLSCFAASTELEQTA